MIDILSSGSQPTYSSNGLAGGYACSCRFGTSSRHISVCTNFGHVFQHGGVYSIHIHLAASVLVTGCR